MQPVSSNQTCSGACSPLVHPARLCFRQFKKLTAINANLGPVEIAKRVALAVVAVLILLPALIIAGAGSLQKVITSGSGPCSKCIIRRTGFKPSIVIDPKLPKPPKTITGSKQTYLEEQYATEDELTAASTSYLGSYDKLKGCQIEFGKQLSPTATDKEIIGEIFKLFRGFCVGIYNYAHKTPKKFLIDNMKYLAESKVKVIFMEGLPYSKQEQLDKYLKGELTDLNEVTQLFEKVQGAKNPEKENTVFAVIEAAKKEGIRVVGINHDSSLFDVDAGYANISNHNYSIKMVHSFVMSKLKAKDRFVVFVSSPNLCKREKSKTIPGVAELLQCPAVLIRDKAKDSERTVFFNNEKENGFEEPLHVEMYA